MLEIALDARRGGFHLRIETVFAQNWTVIFGPSGSGKSTLLRLMAGLDREAVASTRRGRVVFNKRVLTDTAGLIWSRPGERATALVTQQPSLFPHLTVAENVAYGLTRLSHEQRAGRVNEMLELVEARELVHRRPQGLSGGEAQRVALARALAPSPKLLLLDEPFSGIDPIAKYEVQKIIRRLKERGLGILITDHDARETLKLVDRAYLIHHGKVIYEGSGPQMPFDPKARDIYLGPEFNL